MFVYIQGEGEFLVASVVYKILRYNLKRFYYLNEEITYLKEEDTYKLFFCSEQVSSVVGFLSETKLMNGSQNVS